VGEEVFAAGAVAVFVVLEAGDFAEQQADVAVDGPGGAGVRGDELGKALGTGFDAGDKGGVAVDRGWLAGAFSFALPGEDGAALNDWVLDEKCGGAGKAFLHEEAKAESRVLAPIGGLTFDDDAARGDGEGAPSNDRIHCGFAHVGSEGAVADEGGEVGCCEVFKEKVRGVTNASGEQQKSAGVNVSELTCGGEGGDDLVAEKDDRVDWGVDRARLPTGFRRRRGEVVEGEPGADGIEVVAERAESRMGFHATKIGQAGDRTGRG